MPLTNRGLKEDASLKLVLASLGGPERRVLFDEYFHGAARIAVGYGEGIAASSRLAWQCACGGAIADPEFWPAEWAVCACRCGCREVRRWSLLNRWDGFTERQARPRPLSMGRAAVC